MPEKLRGVKTVGKTLADGSRVFYYYHRATGVRLPDDPKSVAFAIALDRADGQAEEARTGVETLSTLIRAYEASNDWKKLAESTKEIGRYDLKAIEARWGDLPLSALSARGMRGDFLEWHDEMAEEFPKAADAKMTRLARVLSFGVDREKITVNPIATFKRVYSSDRSDKLWLPEHIATFNAVAPPRLQAALVIALHTGQRQGDLRALEWSAYDGAGVAVTQGKTGAHVYIPCTAALKATLDGMKAQAEGQAHVLLNSEGVPWTRSAFHTAWDRAFNAAFPEFRDVKGKAVKANPPPPDLHFHDLRGTAITMLAEAGCTVPEIATITGHSLATVTKILERYLSRTRTLAQSAIAKLERKMAA